MLQQMEARFVPVQDGKHITMDKVIVVFSHIINRLWHPRLGTLRRTIPRRWRWGSLTRGSGLVFGCSTGDLGNSSMFELLLPKLGMDKKAEDASAPN